MCGTLDSISDGLTGLSKAVGLKDLGDSVTEGLGIRGVGDLLADFDDALYDMGVRWDSVGQIAAVAAAIYTGGVMAGAWGQGGWLANTLGVTSTTTAGAGATAAAGSSQAAMLAGQTAAFGAEGAALTGQALASATGGAASATNAALMANYGGNALMSGELGAAYGGLTNAGAQGVGMASTGYAPLNTAAQTAMASPGLSGSSVVYDTMGNVVGVNQGSILGGTTSVGAGATGAATGGGWFSNPLVQATALQMGGQMIAGMGTAAKEEELLNKQLAEKERLRKLQTWVSYAPPKSAGLISSRMNGAA